MLKIIIAAILIAVPSYTLAATCSVKTPLVLNDWKEVVGTEAPEKGKFVVQGKGKKIVEIKQVSNEPGMMFEGAVYTNCK